MKEQIIQSVIWHLKHNSISAFWEKLFHAVTLFWVIGSLFTATLFIAWYIAFSDSHTIFHISYVHLLFPDFEPLQVASKLIFIVSTGLKIEAAFHHDQDTQELPLMGLLCSNRLGTKLKKELNCFSLLYNISSNFLSQNVAPS